MKWTKKEIAAMNAEVKAAIESGVPFSLTCTDCDAGMNVGGLVQATADGWQNIQFDPDGMSWNFLGDCSDCVREDATKGTLFAGAATE